MTTLTGIRSQVFLDRYALRNKQGKPMEKHPEEMWQRVAKGVAGVEKGSQRTKWQKEFYRLMEGFKFVPGGRVLMGAGTDHEVTFYNCFVIPSPKDSRAGILETLKTMTEIMARGGGVGFNLSSLRPRDSLVSKVNGTSSGPVNWAEIYSVMTHDIIQQGGSRRGALMLMLWDWHPDLEEFITVKKNRRRLLGANLSVCISDKFMKAVKQNQDWRLVFPDTNDPDYDQLWNGDLKKWAERGKRVKKFKTVKARKLWELICESAWDSAEPGVVFMDRVNNLSNTYYFEKLISTNPCGEQPLPAWGTCNLGAMNLVAYVNQKSNIKNQISKIHIKYQKYNNSSTNHSTVLPVRKFDFEALAKDVRTAVRFMDNVIDAENYIYPQMRERQMAERRIGLGTMGLADALILLKLRYGSEEALIFIKRVYQTIRDSAYLASIELTKEKGSFPKFDQNKYLKSGFIKTLPEKIRGQIRKNGIRNAVLLTQAPTGKTSLLAGVSFGTEPVFAFEYKQKDRLGERMVRHWLYAGLPRELPPYFVTALQLTPDEHVKVQAAIQHYTDSSISKTVNAPNHHTLAEVKRLYDLAYQLGCKGITYMRLGSRKGMLEAVAGVETAKKTFEKVKMGGKLVHEVKPRPSKVTGVTYRLETPVGETFVTINENGQGQPFEMFVTVGKSGSDVSAMAEGLGRLVSLILRLASPLTAFDKMRQIFDQLQGIGGARAVGFGKKRVMSLPDALAKVIAKHFGFKVKNGNGINNGGNKTEMEMSAFDLCPKCGQASLVYEEGCRKCYGCGYTEC